MSISMIKRREACLRLLRSDFDIEGTIEWILNEYADEPTIQRAANKGKLCRNIITIGGTGEHKYLNLVAFQQALVIFSEDVRRNWAAAQEIRISKLEDQLEESRRREQMYRELYDDKAEGVQDLSDQLLGATNKLSEITGV